MMIIKKEMSHMISFIPTKLGDDTVYIIKKEDKERIEKYEKLLIEAKTVLDKVMV